MTTLDAAEDPMAPPVAVTLLTDFGDRDGFVGAMRGVILSRAPRCRLVDLAHHVPRGDVAKAGRVLARSAPLFPAGTVHCVVVDPGVGSERRAIAVQVGGMRFIAPDNGVLGEVIDSLGGRESAGFDARLISNLAARRTAVGRTFHGRDIFAPAAAYLAAGGHFISLGAPAGPLVELPRPSVRIEGDRRIGRVVEVDHFGNLITDVAADGLPPSVRIELRGLTLRGPRAAYAAVEPGAWVLVVGSLGTLEVAVRDGSAAARLGVGVGAACVVDPAPAESGS